MKNYYHGINFITDHCKRNVPYEVDEQGCYFKIFYSKFKSEKPLSVEITLPTVSLGLGHLHRKIGIFPFPPKFSRPQKPLNIIRKKSSSPAQENFLKFWFPPTVLGGEDTMLPIYFVFSDLRNLRERNRNGTR